MSHLERSELEECGKDDPPLHVVNEALLTNGHACLVNGALKLGDSSSDTDETSVGKDLSEFSLKNAADKPQSRAEQFDTKLDPYEFPHSPLKEYEQHSSSKVQRSKPPPPACQEAGKSTENHLLAPSCQAQLSHAPPSSSLTKSPVRLNGCHNSNFSPNTASKSTTENACKAPVQLLVQTSGLISEFYSHSRLHQISTWRSSFSEYVNELHSRRKAAGAHFFPGKERLRKFVAQQDGQGRRGKVVSLPCPVKSSQFSLIILCLCHIYIAYIEL